MHRKLNPVAPSHRVRRAVPPRQEPSPSSNSNDRVSSSSDSNDRASTSSGSNDRTPPSSGSSSSAPNTPVDHVAPPRTPQGGDLSHALPGAAPPPGRTSGTGANPGTSPLSPGNASGSAPSAPSPPSDPSGPGDVRLSMTNRSGTGGPAPVYTASLSQNGTTLDQQSKALPKDSTATFFRAFSGQMLTEMQAQTDDRGAIRGAKVASYQDPSNKGGIGISEGPQGGLEVRSTSGSGTSLVPFKNGSTVVGPLTATKGSDGKSVTVALTNGLPQSSGGGSYSATFTPGADGIDLTADVKSQDLSKFPTGFHAIPHIVPTISAGQYRLWCQRRDWRSTRAQAQRAAARRPRTYSRERSYKRPAKPRSAHQGEPLTQIASPRTLPAATSPAGSPTATLRRIPRDQPIPTQVVASFQARVCPISALRSYRTAKRCPESSLQTMLLEKPRRITM